MQLETTLAKAIYVSCLTIFLTGLASWAVLAHQEAGRTSAQAKTDASDARFARGAALDDMAEIQLGRLASERGSDGVVKAFGERVLVQQGSVDDQLKAAAQKENLALPNKLFPRQQQTYDRLANLNGSAFDRAYAQAMVDAHQRALTDFQNEVGTGKSETIRSFAAQTIPTIQEHLNQAREMRKAVVQTASRGGKESRTSGR